MECRMRYDNITIVAENRPPNDSSPWTFPQNKNVFLVIYQDKERICYVYFLLRAIQFEFRAIRIRVL